MDSRMEEQMLITIQLGFLKEEVTVDKDQLDMRLLRDKARQFLERNVPTSQAKDTKVLLFLHNYHSSNMLQLIESVQEVHNGSVVEIVLSTRHDRPNHPHLVAVQSYFSPTFCDFCGEMLIGLTKQGLRCSKCNQNFHKRCAHAAPNECVVAAAHPPHNASLIDLPNGCGLPHTWAIHSFKAPTVCKFCAKMIYGASKQGLKCRDCGISAHKKCGPQIPQNCRIYEPSPEPASDAVMTPTTPVAPQPFPNTFSPIVASLSQTLAEASIAEDPAMSELIPLGRIPGQAGVRHSRKALPPAIIEGWMLHSSKQTPTKKRHYWRMDLQAIVMYHEDKTPKYYKAIPLAEILAVRPYDGAPLDANGPPHCLEIETADNIYFVGENYEWFKLNAATARLPRRESGVDTDSAKKWLAAIKQALMPQVGRKNHQSTDVSPVEQEATVQFGELYQLYADQELGTGMFGTVYSGVHRFSQREVAVKVISKERSNMNTKWKDTLRNEIAILQKLNHPGIITLEAVFEFPDKIYLVMEKMRADMLEMILSNRNGRLSERITRFLIVQILKALKYLHEQDIAHCDLKPENVLLSSAETDFPQTKLCDFGFARMIEENQFRKTVVGTPAYMAPELLQKRPYNKSLDMWSVGVVIYVTLSGTFPFNEGEAIEDQIQNADFMFPHNLWHDISPAATDMISRLLKFQIEERLTVDECLQHQWLQMDQILYSDLRALEDRLAVRYLTSEVDEKRYGHR